MKVNNPNITSEFLINYYNKNYQFWEVPKIIDIVNKFGFEQYTPILFLFENLNGIQRIKIYQEFKKLPIIHE